MQSFDAATYAKVREAEPFSPPPLRYVREAFGRSVAVVLGVNAYQAGVPRLKTPVPDADAVGALLETQHGFKKVLRCDAEVTGERVRALFKGKLRDELGGELVARDRLLVYFAGHGLSLPSEHGPEGHLLFADADPADPRTFFAMSELRKLLGALPCRHLLVVLDCCFAGTFRWAGRRRERSDLGARTYRETLERYVNYRAWQVLVSASHDQTALDAIGTGRPLDLSATRRPLDSLAPVVDALAEHRLETGRHSPFATALLRGLRGEADFTKDGLIVAAELELFVRDLVEKSTQVHQTPQLYKLDEHERGEFVFQVPGTTLDLEPAPALSLAACPYQGLQPYGAPERERFFGRNRATGALADRVKAHPFTALMGPSGVGKSSLLRAGLAPALRDTKAWTVLEARPGTTPDTTLRDRIEVSTEGGLDPGITLAERIGAWMSAHPSGQLCLALDQAEELETLAQTDARNRTLADLAQALGDHGTRLRVVFALRSEFAPVFRASALAPFWAAGAFVVPPLTQDELREIIERPARAHELSFDPPELVDTLINEVMQAPGGLPLLSFALRELYLRCATRNRDRLLVEHDYAAMGRLSGALAQRATELLADFIAKDAAYEATARHVFLRMVVSRDGDWLRRRVKRDELTYADRAENRRVEALLKAFEDARLLVSDKNECEPAHDELVRGWPAFSTWRAGFGDAALALLLDLADAARRWVDKKRPGYLWDDDERLPAALRAAREPASWLNARERDFVTASDRRRRRRVYALIVTIAVIMLGALSTWDFYYRKHVSYCQNYVRRWGAPEGVDELSIREARQRSSKVKFVRKGRLGKVERVELMGGTDLLAHSNEKGLGSGPELDIGQKAEGERMPCQWHFDYDASGEVFGETAQDRAGRPIYTLHYLPSPREKKRAQFFDPIKNVSALSKQGNAELIEFVRSAEGLDTEKRYLTSRGLPAREQNGVSIERLQYDESLHIIVYSVFDEVGRSTRRKDGVAGWRLKYDERGNLIERAFFDEAGKPVRAEDGVAGWRAKYDERGNEVERAFFDEAGKPVRSKNGNAGWRAKYDERGNEVEQAYFDEAGKLVRSKNGVALVHSTFDERGNEVEQAYFDEAGKPVRSKNGNAGWRAKYDERGDLIERAYFDEAGKPARHQDGVALIRSTFDERGNEVERTFLNEAGELTRHKDGFARWRLKYDERGNLIELAYFDEAGEPVRDEDGVAGWRAKYDERGNEVERAFFDEAGKPVRSNNGNAGWRSTFDERGNLVEQAYFDAAGKPVRTEDGFALVRSTFDERGNEVEQTYFDEAGKPIRHKEGFAGWRSRYDERGNEVETDFFDEASKPVRSKNGNAGWRSRYDERSNEVERAFFDETGKPVRTEEGFAVWRAKYDERDNLVEQAYFDAAGKPTRHKDGNASRRLRYDERGNEVEQAYFDKAGRPCATKQGVATVRRTYNDRDEVVEVARFDLAGRLLAPKRP
jgi:YD repeat-containing protein